jgi:hypothetical protein
MATIVTGTPASTPTLRTVEQQRIHDLALQVVLDASSVVVKFFRTPE